MVLVYGLIAGLIFGLLFGGRIGALEAADVRGGWVFLGALLVQMAAPVIPFDFPAPLPPWLLWVLPTSACAVVVALNIRNRGFGWVLLGLLLNLLVVVANSGMPVMTSNAAFAGGSMAVADSAVSASWLHVPMGATTNVRVLADVIPVPGPSWSRGLVSIGDVLISVGLGLYLFIQMVSARHVSEG